MTALSHEIAETFNDHFATSDNVHNVTPWWKSGPQCQDALEVGDVVESVSNSTYPISMNGATYHVQTEALVPWFEEQQPSSAIGGAYSYPNTSVLTSPSVSQNVNCQ